MNTIRVVVNGESRALDVGCTVAVLIQTLKLGERRLAVEHNGEILPRSMHAGTRLAEGDRVEIIHAIGGG